MTSPNKIQVYWYAFQRLFGFLHYDNGTMLLIWANTNYQTKIKEYNKKSCGQNSRSIQEIDSVDVYRF